MNGKVNCFSNLFACFKFGASRCRWTRCARCHATFPIFLWRTLCTRTLELCDGQHSNAASLVKNLAAERERENGNAFWLGYRTDRALVIYHTELGEFSTHFSRQPRVPQQIACCSSVPIKAALNRPKEDWYPVFEYATTEKLCVFHFRLTQLQVNLLISFGYSLCAHSEPFMFLSTWRYTFHCWHHAIEAFHPFLSDSAAYFGRLLMPETRRLQRIRLMFIAGEASSPTSIERTCACWAGM